MSQCTITKSCLLFHFVNCLVKQKCLPKEKALLRYCNNPPEVETVLLYTRYYRAGRLWISKYCSHSLLQMLHLDSGAMILAATQRQWVRNSTQGYMYKINCLEVAVPKRIKFVWAVLPCMHILTESVASHFIMFFTSLFCFRWVQWGAFSPIFRPHCGKTGDDVRRIWLYPEVSH